jgi:hypothetical protein
VLLQFHPAEVAAKKMEKKIHDQLEESHAKKHLRAAAFETALVWYRGYERSICYR